MNPLRGWLLAAACLATAPAFGADTWAPAKKLDAYLDALEKSQLVSGTLTITEKGESRYQRSIGFATIENGKPQPADEATRYRAGPVSMLLTAVLVMQRAETASITLDTPLAEFLPDLPNALVITYRDLLGHRSGLADYTAAPGYETWRTQPRTRAQMLETIIAGGTRFAPRERVEFNDSNYLLLGYILEKVHGRSYDDLILRNIAGKLGLSRTYFAGTSSSTLESRVLPAHLDWLGGATADRSFRRRGRTRRDVDPRRTHANHGQRSRRLAGERELSRLHARSGRRPGPGTVAVQGRRSGRFRA